jgi:predicted GIY-YIG superfamily endonuclease
VYKIVDADTQELLYVGETQQVKKRLTTHDKKNWHCQTPCFSLVPFQERIQKYQLHEMENDLLGGFYAQSQTMPRFQLIDHR